MYKNGEAAIARIIELVDKCPKEHQGTCFEVLLAGYVQMEVGVLKPNTQMEQMKQNVQAFHQSGQQCGFRPTIAPAITVRNSTAESPRRRLPNLPR